MKIMRRDPLAMHDTHGYVANTRLVNYFANPIPRVPSHQEMITSSMSSPNSAESSRLSSCQYHSMGMLHETNLEDKASRDVDFAKFQHLMNFPRNDQDINLNRSGEMNFMDKSDENTMAIDLSRTPETNFARFQDAVQFNNRFQETTNFNNRFQETTNFNNRFHDDINYNLPHHAARFTAFGSNVQYPDYSTFSVNTDKSLVIRHRQNSSQRHVPYQRVNVKSRRSSNPDDVSSTVDPSPHRANANDRERERTRNLNAAFAELRTHVPSMPSDKLSKIQTLRLASKYIHFLLYVLQNGLGGDDVDSGWNCRLLTHERLGKKFSMWRLQGTWTS